MTAGNETRSRSLVLHISPGGASRFALEAAMRVARAFEAEVESLFVEDEGLLSLAGLPFAREVSLTGRRTRALTEAVLQQDLRSLSEALQREVQAMAQAAQVAARFTVVRGRPEDALRQAIARARFLAMAEPAAGSGRAGIRTLATCLPQLEGCLFVGAGVRRTAGPVIALVESLEAGGEMARIAERLAAPPPGQILLLALEATRGAGERLRPLIDDAARREAELRVETIDTGLDAAAAVAATVRRAAGGLLIARYGAGVTRSEDEVAWIARRLECPLFLLRATAAASEDGPPQPAGATSDRT